jgi:hypothetical protein
MSAHEKPSEHVDWLTPAWIFDALDVQFDVDPAASASPHSTVPMSYQGVRHIGSGGADNPWPVEALVWLNPPYGKECEAFMQRMLQHHQDGGAGLALLPARTDTRWWHDGPGKMHAAWFLFLKGRVHFVRGDTGEPGPSPAFPSVLVAWGPHGKSALYNSGLAGMLVHQC